MLLILQARDRKSGTVVALKLYRMHKLNDISNHQVAREVRSHPDVQQLMGACPWKSDGVCSACQDS